MMSVSPDGSIVALIGGRGTAVGVGVLIGAREIITCAHVVNAALGLDPRSQPQPTGAVRVRFPLADARETTPRG